MQVEVRLPDLGKDAPEKATMSFFYFEEGQRVKMGDDFAELVTDKASFAVPSPVSGTVVRILVQEGQEVSVGQAMAVIETA